MDEDKRITGKIMLCNNVARKIKNNIMKDFKGAESDIASACSIFHKKHEQKTRRPIETIGEFEQVTKEFSNLPISEIDKLIEEGKELDKRRSEAIETIRNSNI